MEKRTYQELANIYRKMYQIDEKIGARGSVSNSGAGHADAETVKARGNKPVTGGWTGSQQYGLGRNYKGDKDKVKKRADDQYKADRKAAALERRKDGSAKPSKLDNLLKDIRNS